MIPVVIGPKARPYVIDHHHLARALLEEGQKEVLIQPVAHIEALSQEHFWRFLDNQGLLHPFNENGERCSYDDIPKSIARLKDDPFRSACAGAVRTRRRIFKGDPPLHGIHLGRLLPGKLQSARDPPSLEADAGSGGRNRAAPRCAFHARVVRTILNGFGQS